MSGPLVTVGHGTAGQDELAALLTGARVRLVVDVRRFPGSRAHPHVRREALESWLPEHGTAYRWEPRLGGRRRSTGGRSTQDGADRWWTVEAFRAYAGHTRTPEFRDALDELLGDVRGGDGAVAVLCSETVWWRCHRRLIADVVALTRDDGVVHLMHDGRLQPHPPAAGARVTADGAVVWDGG